MATKKAQERSEEATISCAVTAAELFLLERLVRQYICEQMEIAGGSDGLEMQNRLMEKLQALKR